MLSIGKLGHGQERYYLDKVAEGAEDYYSGEGEARGRLDRRRRRGPRPRRRGRAPTSSTAMLTGRNPVDGEPLLGCARVAGRRPGPRLRPHLLGAEVGLPALGARRPRSPPLEVQAAHREAVEAALDYLQREACWTRRGAGGAEFVQGNGYLAAAYRHRSSRNGDPQLHTHVLIANATQGPDGRWTRLYHPAIYDHAKTAGYIYEAHLRHELTRRLGVALAGGPQRHRRDRGLRRRAPARLLDPPRGNPRGGRADASARARQIATLATRKREGGDVSRESLRERWRARAEEIGLDRETIARDLRPERDRADRSRARTVSTGR